MNFFKRIIKEEDALIRRYVKIAKAIDSFANHMKSLSDADLKAQTQKFKNMISNGKELIEILPEAYATAREAAFRVRKEFPFFVQLIGAIILHNGDVAEMKTGEGKTLTSLMPIYLNAVKGEGVIVVTTNEYLSKRDSITIGKILKFLGITTGWVSSEQKPHEKRNNYYKDVTYISNSEIGFDYLRDNMIRRIDDKVQRKFNYAIIDECDSVLIDEARTPLIISGGERNLRYSYNKIDKFVKTLNEDDYIIDIESRNINLSKPGQKKCEKHFNLSFLFQQENAEIIHGIINSLRANFIFEKGVEYLVKDNKIFLVDFSTGRIMHGRSYSDGLHQAIEAKENVEISKETTVIATITYQNLFRLFNKLSGMTGTAKTEEDEFQKIYNMRVICVPTNLPLIRVDSPDFIFQNAKAKFKALLEEIEYRHKLKQPILIGTRSVEDSEHISTILHQLKIKHNILNAKNNEREADIIKNAGQMSVVTIATNMAGRGTDIVLGKGVSDIGGLCVLATDKHESRRIDNQLRGRSGRQGDPGHSRFFLSLEDELIVRFGGDKLRGLFSLLGDNPLESKMVTRKLNQAQRKIEGINFDTRKSLLEYDNILSEQREVMYKQRNLILESNDEKHILDIYFNMIEGLIYNICTQYYYEDEVSSNYDYKSLLETIDGKFIPYNFITIESLKENSDDIVKYITKSIYDAYFEKRDEYNSVVVHNVEKTIILNTFDYFWTFHIDNMFKLRASIHLRSYGQKNPLQQYIEEASNLFKGMKDNISINIIHNLNSYKISEEIDNNSPQTQTKVSVKIG